MVYIYMHVQTISISFLDMARIQALFNKKREKF